MAINIFKNKIKKTTTNTSAKLIEAFELFLDYKNNNKDLLKFINNNEEFTDGIGNKLLYMDKQTKDFNVVSLSKEPSLENKLPIMIRDTKGSDYVLISPKHTLNITKYLSLSSDNNIVNNFVNELETLKNQIIDIKTNNDKEDDLTINIGVYPLIKDYLTEYNQEIINDNRANKENIIDFMKNIFQIMALANVKTIKQGTSDKYTIDLNKLNQNQEIQYVYTNYYCITEAISND